MSYTVFANTQSMPYEVCLDCRRQGIGGPEAGVGRGVSRSKSPVELWVVKTGQPPTRGAPEDTL